MNRTPATNTADTPAVRILTPAEAAGIIYNVRDPSIEQIGKVVARIKSGAIRSSSKGGMTTTPDAIAEYLSKRQLARPNATGEKNAKSRDAESMLRALQPAAIRKDENETLSACYHSFMREYFRAVLFQRMSGKVSTFFRSMVFATQIVVLAAIFLLGVSLIGGGIRLSTTSPQEKAIRRWLGEHFKEPELRQLVKIPTQANQLQAKFRYFSGSRQVESEIIFNIQGDQVAPVASEDE